jgi:hypothetical protein
MGLLGRFSLQVAVATWASGGTWAGSSAMHQIIYLVGLIVVIMFILSFLGLR